MKKSFIVAAALLCLVLLAACGAQSPASSASASAQLPNPLTEYGTVEEAAAAMGIAVQQPAWLPEGYSQTLVQAIDNSVLEVRYSDGADGEINYRMAEGGDDISGDYNEYSVKTQYEANGFTGTLSGNEEDSCSLATLTKDGFSYALSFSTPVNFETLDQIIASIAA